MAIKITIGLLHQFRVVGITDACFMCSPDLRFDMGRTPNRSLFCIQVIKNACGFSFVTASINSVMTSDLENRRSIG